MWRKIRASETSLLDLAFSLYDRSDEDEVLAGMEMEEKTHAPRVFQQCAVDDVDMDDDVDERGRVQAHGDVDKMSFIEHGKGEK